MQEVEGRTELKRGILVAIEGIDGAGKTTQAALLTDRLNQSGYSVVRFHEPTDGIWGDKIRDLAKNGRHKTNAEDELDFFYRDRMEDVEKNINPALREKKVVIMDRYYFSSVAYQGARGLDPDYVEEKNEKIAPKPDILIILDITPEAAMKRIRQKRNSIPNHFERTAYLEKVRQIFLKKYKTRGYVRVVKGDDTRSEKDVAQEILETVLPIVKGVEES